ncbi:MAG: hypothetical protein A3D28_00395 [Omnitrophica bacterium RIFCSPHIGHO2_02_FULL_63_14]|nr:MAG: hypothetical protein A3D28_00395 [Omnitrophica bacterium RIFCSPHIGHO2_02_FULL_63_14]
MKKDTPKNRRDCIFKHIVHSYVETAEPVGSQALSKRFNLGLSPASIRNVMVELEELGLIAQPHTSAGRVPTERGYRYYVDSLMRPEPLAEREKGWIGRQMREARSMDSLVENVSKAVSKLTGNAAIIYIPHMRRVSFLNHLLEELVEAEKLNDFFEEDEEVFIEGAFRMLAQPEFRDAARMGRLLQAFDEKSPIVRILIRDLEEDGLHVHIGSENAPAKLEGVSLVVRDCTLGGHPIGGVAVLGPIRMPYARIISVVDYVADSVGRAMERF